jgi:hypothetical protein
VISESCEPLREPAGQAPSDILERYRFGWRIIAATGD